MVGQHHRLNGHEIKAKCQRRHERTEKPGMLQSMGWKESDTTEQLNNNNSCIGQGACGIWEMSVLS